MQITLTRTSHQTIAMQKKNNQNLKSPVTIRTRELKDGRKSIFFDIFNDGVRTYKFLKMYLEPETTAKARQDNAKTMKQVEKIRTELALELTYSRAGLEDRSFKAGVRLVDWMDQYEGYLVRNGGSRSFGNNIIATRKYLERFNSEILLKDVDGLFIDGFIDFLKKQKYTRGDKQYALAHNTICCRIRNLHSALNFAVRQKLIAFNPCLDAETRVDEQECKKTYLNVEEVKRLIDTPCPSDVLKRAFLFSVFSGLRLGDVRSLTWRDIIRDGENWRVEIRMQKTREMLYLPLNRMARKWFKEPEHHEPDDKVFKGLGVSFREPMSTWMKDAGISKKVGYHTSRHSFAVLALDAGVDLYTCSSLMGHASIENTQVYADIMTGKKVSTVALLDNVLD